MAVGIYRDTRVLVQGITGKQGLMHTKLCLGYGTKIVAGVTPGKGGTVSEGVEVFDSVAAAKEASKADMSLIFVPPMYAADAILEAIFAGIQTVVCITEGIPVHDMMKVKRVLTTYESVLIGPNCPGIISPGEAKAGIMPGHVFKQGRIGILSRSGTLLYEAASQLARAGKGVSTALGIGGDPIIGTDYCYWLEHFERDPRTEAVLLIGEIGGELEEAAADYVARRMTKAVYAFVAGQSAPKGKRMGHAGAIATGSTGSWGDKVRAFQDAGVHVVADLADIHRVFSEQ
ncbi:succinate--CoA ligase subunit alpha [Candidatus Fermentibacteria bacterium]|nr:MAG: succinate--CoA ligase subunit alpha [Candidatus Fermentibacteria bacterium]